MPFSPEPPSDALLERGAELEAIAAALEAARAGEGALVVVEGPAGIGKTRLVRAARDAAGRAGMAVLAARASNLERGFEWGVVRQLLETPVIAQGDDVLKGPAALATSLVSPDADARSDEGALLHGLYWLCANLAERGPVLLTVDDAHWSDLPSLRFVAYLARRVEGLALAVVVAARPGEDPSSRSC